MHWIRRWLELTAGDKSQLLRESNPGCLAAAMVIILNDLSALCKVRNKSATHRRWKMANFVSPTVLKLTPRIS